MRGTHASITPIENPVEVSSAGGEGQLPPMENVMVTCHENEVPPFVEAELEHLYENVYSSLPQLEVSGVLDANVSTYIVRRCGTITAMFLFRRGRREVRVLNEGISIDDDELQRFARYIFSAYPTVGAISFHAIQARITQLPFLHQRFNCLEDIVLTLPDTAAKYLALMGSSTRSYIKRYMSKLHRSFPSFSHKVYVTHEIDEQQLHDIVRLNEARMTDKGKTPGIDHAEMRRIIQLAGKCGLVSVLMLDGRICAGTINYRIGRNYFLEVIAHDPRYNDYRLGTLCCYLTICECIARGGAEYHFLWGQNEYKYRLLGVNRDLEHLTIFRSRVQLFRCADTALKNVFQRCLRVGKMWLQKARHNDKLFPRILVDAIHSLRTGRYT